MIENIELFGVNEKLLQDIFNISIPIGHLYTQYPAQPSPTELYNVNGIKSVWEEQLQYNSAFFRSNKPNTELWTPDNGIHFYKESNKDYPVNISGITGGRSSGVTYYNQNEGITYTKWSGWNIGLGKEFNDALQTNQNKSHKHENTISVTQPTMSTLPFVKAMNFRLEARGIDGKGNSAEMSSSTSGRNSNDPNGMTSSLSKSRGSNTDATDNNSGKGRTTFTVSFSHTHTVTRTKDVAVSITNVNDGGNEFRPDNYTIRIWKRIL